MTFMDMYRARIAPNTDGSPPWDGDLFWSKSHASKISPEYPGPCVMLPFIGPADWDLRHVTAFNAAVKAEFGLTRDIAWIGIVRHGKKRGAPADSARFWERPGHDIAFLVHADDVSKLDTDRRLDVGFRWFFDVVGQGDGEGRRFPPSFLRMYR